ncbi:F-box/FBD/LRR-repeat protein At1g13570-like [Panicum virgatum]|uniref:F-box domain-containing protein n=1 Tax=Panicum virgatum TaxID=38727 RepID=A0A8T0S144_PANVG|nr:F-box/FBD/LRR-repeat protein At1g13570-like [Panicum virgatum]KAG2591384.1 hypothetical protein PVAP13_5NG478186 [Panicum virgatum]
MAADVGTDLPCDRLSDLPDAILVSILSLLRLDEAARCTVLAPRWRRLFSSTLLLNFNANMPDRLDTIGTVNSILAAHPTAPVRSFRASWRFIPPGKDLSSGGWLQELARRGVEELFLDFDFHGWHHRIPDSLFDCSSLKRLRASACTFPDVPKAGFGAAPAPPLARLTEIELDWVVISDAFVNFLLSQCTALERLSMYGTSNCGLVHVRSPSLKILKSEGDFDKLFIEYAPNLEWLLGEYMHLKGEWSKGVCLKIAHAPKLKFMGYLSMNLHKFEIGETMFTEHQIIVKTLMPSLKTLAIEVSYTYEGYIDWIIQLLNLFPCLEALYIRSDTWSRIQAAASESWDVLRHNPCVHNHLEKVVFEAYRGQEWQQEMAKFLHGRSRVLKAVEFHCMRESGGGTKDHTKPPSVEWVRKQQELLCLDRRASKDARFLFFRGKLPGNHWDNCHHDWYKRKYYDEIYEV